MFRRYSLPLVLLLLPIAGYALDLTHATVKIPRAPTRDTLMAATLLIDEVRARTYVTLDTRQMSEPEGVVISIRESADGAPPEGYVIKTNATGVTIEGAAPRGVIYGVGRLLRTLEMSRGRIVLPRDLNVASIPATKLRGHQLGYRPKTNSYDGWTTAMWEQYMRDLLVFGTNAIELIPPRSDDDADSPHFTLPPLEMMIQMSRLAASYGLEVWVWYPALDADYTTDAAIEKAVAEWSDVLRRLPRVSAVFVPGGDPGHTRPAVLMKLLERQAASLRKYHPQAAMWVSPQGFSEEWLDEFYSLLRAEPAWLTGVVHGPQVRPSIHELRTRVPARYPIRNYPDITHSLQSQFAVPDWDAAHALTQHREPVNPRPAGMRRIFLDSRRDTIGFLTYSEGCNDDVNKFIWSGLGWDPQAGVQDVLRDYARYFLGAAYAEPFSQILMDLEQNWRGPIASNAQIEKTLAEVQTLERAVSPRELLNWRFQQAQYRAYYDAFTRRRFLGDINNDLRTRVFALAEALFQSIRMQLSVPLYRAISRDRGATLDNIDWPITDRMFHGTRPSEPGPGEFYDDLGNPEREPHLVRSDSVRTGFGSTRAVADGLCRIASFTVAEGLYDAPVTLRYTGLAKGQPYRVRVIYGGERPRLQRLVANGTYELQSMRRIEALYEPVEFSVPLAATTASGELTLEFTGPSGLGGSGRTNQVAEVWLLKGVVP